MISFIRTQRGDERPQRADETANERGRSTANARHGRRVRHSRLRPGLVRDPTPQPPSGSAALPWHSRVPRWSRPCPDRPIDFGNADTDRVAILALAPRVDHSVLASSEPRITHGSTSLARLADRRPPPERERWMTLLGTLPSRIKAPIRWRSAGAGRDDDHSRDW